MTSATCGCSDRGLVSRDPAQHAAWHALVVEQGGPATGPVDLATLRQLHGLRVVSLTEETFLDERARTSGKRASGAQREACS